MSSCTGDSGSTVKRSFSDMENNEMVDNVSVGRTSSFPMPKGFHDNHFIAIREKEINGDHDDDANKVERKAIPKRSCCIVGCWDDAQMYLKQLKIEGRNVEYDAFEELDAATRYAFGKDALQQDECDPQAPDINAMSSISPFMENYQKMTLALQPSHLGDDTLSDLERLPQEILTNIYKYLFTSWWHIEFLSKNVSTIGMISKNMYQTCVSFVQQEAYLRIDSNSLDSTKNLAFFLGNGARLDGLHIDGTSLTSSCNTWLKLNFCNLSRLNCLVLGTHIPHHQSFREILFEAPPPAPAKQKWDLVEDGLLSFKVVNEFERKSKKYFYEECSRLIATKWRLPSLQKIAILNFPTSLEVYNPLLLCVADRLEELNVELDSDWTMDSGERFRGWNKAKIKRIEQLVQEAPRLKKLDLSLMTDFSYNFKVWSKSLESLEIYDSKGGAGCNVLDINCPILTNLRMKIDLESFGPNSFVAHSNIRSIRVMHLSIFSSHSGDILRNNIAGRRVSEILGQMTLLKDLHLEFMPPSLLAFNNLPDIEHLTLDCAALDSFSHSGSSLKKLGLKLISLAAFTSGQFECDLENVVQFTAVVTSLEEDEDPDQELAFLFQTIEKRMPKLRSFTLDFVLDFGYLSQLDFMIKSQTLEEIDLPNELVQSILFDCPLLKRFNGNQIREKT